MSKIKLFILLVVIINIVNFATVGILIYHNSQVSKDKSQPLFSLPFKNSTSLVENPVLNDQVTIQKVFADDHTWTATLSADHVRTLIATGDIIPARSVNNNVVTRNDFKWPYEKTYEFLKSGDITLVNLETPIIDNCPTTTEGMIFCGDSKNIEGLVYAGVDVANLANNHSGNHGMGGLDFTRELLHRNNIVTDGNEEIGYKDIRGIKFAFLGFEEVPGSDPLPNHVDDKLLVQKIHEAQKTADIIVVSFHWGDEYTPQPNARQQEIAHETIDAGADVVIGNHPHWIQPFEIYKNKFIMYAHGNFIFDQMWSHKTELGVVGKYTFYDKKLIDVEYSPIEIADLGQPYFLQGNAKEEVLKDLREQSIILKDESNF